MPIFDKREGMPERPKTREILDIIFDMLASDVPEDKILSMLRQMGMGDEEARQTLSAGKQKFDALVKSSLSAAVDKLLAKEKEELLERVDSKVDSMRKDLLLKVDMSGPQQQKIIDSKISPLAAEISALKDDLYSTKAQMDNRVKELEDKEGKTQKRTADILLPVLLMILGIFVMFFGANQLRDLIMQFDPGRILELVLYIVVAVIGLAFIIVGFQKYPKELKTAE